jgi:hypothetical protein
MSGRADREITGLPFVEPIIKGFAIRLQFQFQDGSNEWFRCGSELLHVGSQGPWRRHRSAS